MRKSALAVALGVMSAVAPAHAEELITSYTAYLSSHDHFNSNGQRLTTAAAIIRQDRANFHRFHTADNGDQWDSVFASVDARQQMETLLSHGTSSPDAIQAIVNGTPWITVEVWGWPGRISYVNVTVN